MSKDFGITLQNSQWGVMMTHKKMKSKTAPGVCEEIARANVPCGACLRLINGRNISTVDTVTTTLAQFVRPVTFTFTFEREEDIKMQSEAKKLKIVNTGGEALALQVDKK